jgi:hypothetical protein
MSEYTAQDLYSLKTIELRKIAREIGITEANGRKVNAGRKNDLVNAILGKQSGLDKAKAFADFRDGAYVKTNDDRTGRIVGEPSLMPGGYVVTVAIDGPKVTPSGSADYFVADLDLLASPEEFAKIEAERKAAREQAAKEAAARRYSVVKISKDGFSRTTCRSFSGPELAEYPGIEGAKKYVDYVVANPSLGATGTWAVIDNETDEEVYRRSIPDREAQRKAAEAKKAAARQEIKAHRARQRKGICFECGERKIDKKTAGRDSTLCRLCWDYAGDENQHNDDGHEAITEPTPELAAEIERCPVCHPELDPRKASGTPEVDPKIAKKVDKQIREIGDALAKDDIAYAKATAVINHRLARRFADTARAAGFDVAAALVGPNHLQLQVEAKKDDVSIALSWDGRNYIYAESRYVAKAGARAIKVRNVSAALKIIAELA